jgi:hypothetical protein
MWSSPRNIVRSQIELVNYIMEIITYLDDLVIMVEYSDSELPIEQLWSLLAELIYILSHEIN